MIGNAVAAIVLGIGLGALASGCGVKSAPIAPELARPQPIGDLHASADAGGIKLTWERPERYVSGKTLRDLEGFVILRGESAGSMEPLVELPVNDQERFSPQREFAYVDGETAIGHRYAYEIVSKTLSGYPSAPSNRVDFTRVEPAPPPNPENFKVPQPPPLPGNSP